MLVEPALTGAHSTLVRAAPSSRVFDWVDRLEVDSEITDQHLSVDHGAD